VDISPDYEDLFKLLNEHKIKYLVVGAYAVMYYSAPRFTKDIDIWISSEENDPEKILKVIAEYGSPVKGLRPQDFLNKRMILQIGVSPVRIDILLDLPRLSFSSAWKNRKRSKYGETPIHVLGLKELIQAKKEAGRPQDKLDLERLLESSNRNARKFRKKR